MLSRHALRGLRLPAARPLASPLKSALRSTASALNTNFKTLVEMQLRSCEINAKRELFGVRQGEAYSWITYAQFAEMVSHFRTALALRGIKKDDKVKGGRSLVYEPECGVVWRLYGGYMCGCRGFPRRTALSCEGLCVWIRLLRTCFRWSEVSVDCMI